MPLDNINTKTCKTCKKAKKCNKVKEYGNLLLMVRDMIFNSSFIEVSINCKEYDRESWMEKIA